MAWYFSAQSVPDLALALLLIIIATYLFSLKQKSKATRWLAGYCVVFGIVLAVFFASTALLPGEAYRAFQTVVHVLGLGGLPLGWPATCSSPTAFKEISSPARRVWCGM